MQFKCPCCLEIADPRPEPYKYCRVCQTSVHQPQLQGKHWERVVVQILTAGQTVGTVPVLQALMITRKWQTG